MARPHILIVSPASARENNGNWQTASRWMRFLAARARVTIAQAGTPGQAAPDLLIALHARRSAAPLAAFAAAHPERPSLLALTGTDLYRDIHQTPARAPRWPMPRPWCCCSRRAWTNWRPQNAPRPT
jgi:hypothetical protein